jgi:hypothetical protein
MSWPSVTKDGDSGALVVNDKQEVVGHLIGAIPDEYDLIQAIHYQLEAIKLPDIRM